MSNDLNIFIVVLFLIWLKLFLWTFRKWKSLRVSERVIGISLLNPRPKDLHNASCPRKAICLRNASCPLEEVAIATSNANQEYEKPPSANKEARSK